MAAALAVEAKLDAFGPGRLLGGDYYRGAGLWTPDVPVPALPPQVDMRALLSAQRVLRELTLKLDRRLPKNGRQLILPNPAQTFRLGDDVLAADLTPSPGSIILVRPVTLDQTVGCQGGLSMLEVGRCQDDAEMTRLIDHWLDGVAENLAFHINKHGINTFAPSCLDHVPVETEGAVIIDRKANLALRSWRYYDEAQRTHEFRFDVLGASV